jgi:sugar lactone lactonase YvrE
MKKVISFTMIFIFAFVAVVFLSVPLEATGKSSPVITGFSTVQLIGMPDDDFIGSISLSEANLYEKDFNSKYMFPMQGICSIGNGKIAVLDNAYGRIHILNSLMDNELTFGDFDKFSYPTDIAFYNGHFYVTDPLKDRVIVYGKDGNYLLSFGENTFISPIGIAVNSSGIYVSDYFKGKIYLLDFNYHVKKSVSIDYPGGLFTDGNKVYVVSMSQREIFILNTDLGIINSFTDPHIIFPSDLSTDSSGNIYVVDRGLMQGKDSNGRVLKFTSSGKFSYTIGMPASSYPNQPDGDFLTPCGIAVVRNNVFVMDAGYYYWDAESEAPFGSPIGSRLTEMSTAGIFIAKKDFSKKDGILVNPLDATLDKNGDLWVVNYGSMNGGELVEFSPSGDFIRAISKIGRENPTSVYCVYSDKKGHILIGTNDSIVVLDNYGNFLGDLFSSDLSEVRSIIKGKNGHFYATVMDKRSVVEFALTNDTGNLLKILHKYFVCNYPAGVAEDAGGKFYITSVDDNKVHVYNSEFQEIGTIGAGGGRGKTNFYVPDSVGIDKFGNIVVADTENGRLSVFDSGGNLIYQSPRDFYEISSIEIEDGMLIATDCFHNVVRIINEDFKTETHAFFASIYPEEQIVSPGEEADFTINISNAGREQDTYNIFVEKNFPPDWYVTLGKNSVSLNGGESTAVNLKITPPANASDGDSIALNIVVSSPRKSVSLKATVIVSTKLPPKLVVKPQQIMLSQNGIVNIYAKGLKNASGISFEMHIPDNLYVRSIAVGDLFKSPVMAKKTIGSKVLVAVSSLDKEVVSGGGTVVKLSVGSVNVGSGVISFEDAYCVNIIGGKTSFVIKSSPIVVSPFLAADFSDGITVTEQNFSFTGRTSGASKVFVNGQPVKLDADGTFTATVVLSSYKNTITVVAVSENGITTTIKKTVYYNGKKNIVIKLQIGNPVMTVNGVKMEIDPGRNTKPFIKPGWNRTLVPIRAIVESLGGTVGWEPKTRMVWIIFNSTEINLWIDKPQAKVNNILVWIDPSNHAVSPIIQNDRTFVPIRFVAENLGCSVLWDDSTKTVTIIYKE